MGGRALADAARRLAGAAPDVASDRRDADGPAARRRWRPGGRRPSPSTGWSRAEAAAPPPAWAAQRRQCAVRGGRRVPARPRRATRIGAGCPRSAAWAGASSSRVSRGASSCIDDYGHHPTAIRATLAAVRERYPGRPVWAVHEPLTYPPDRGACSIALADALAEADHVVIADIWAGRDPDTTITSAAELADGRRAPSGRDGRRARERARPPPSTWPPASARAMSSWSWAAVARTSSRSGWSELLGEAGPRVELGACPTP